MLFTYVASSPPNPVRVLTVQNRINNNTTTLTSKDKAAVYLSHIVATDCTSIGLNLNGWYNNANEVNMPNAYEFTVGSIQISTTSVPVTWSGVRNITINPGDNDINSDEIPASAFSLSYIPRGTIIWTKVIYTVASGDMMPTTARDYRAVTNQQSWQYLAANTTVANSQVDSTGVFTSTGTAPANFNLPCSPMILGRPLVDGLSFVAVGDSITEGVGDSTSNTTTAGAAGQGWLQRAMHSAAGLSSDPLPCINLARSGNGHSSYMGSNTKWSVYGKYAKYPIMALGTNTIGASGSGSLATVKSGETAVIAVGAVNNTQAPVRWALTPRTSSANNWSDNVQTPLAAAWDTGGTAEQFNTYTFGQIGTVYVVQLNQSSLLSPLDPWHFNYDGTPNAYAADTTHPSPGGHDACAIDFRPVLRALP